jgi:two-component system, OmpR family, alkaline phosphatase synthesis response regulator PhoP
MGKKILIVDDEPDIILMVGTRLKANGYEIISAGDGQAGYEMAQKEKPDLVILDLMLPKMDGYKVCGFLKRDYRYAKIPILMFTAKAQEEDMKLAREMGADAYLVKPFKPEELLGKIRELLPSA